MPYGGHMKEIMQGNSAIARGAWEAGVKIAAAYPGTPSSEILREIAENYSDIYAEWSTNEKVALEVASGAALAGARAMASMKHVGLNVASDPFMTLAYTGIKGGLVIIVAQMTRSGKPGKIDVISRGFTFMQEQGKLLHDLVAETKKAIHQTDQRQSINEPHLRDKVRKHLEKFIFQRTHRQPMILPVIIET